MEANMPVRKNGDGTTTWISPDESVTITRNEQGKTIERTNETWGTKYSYDENDNYKRNVSWPNKK
jgi:YD repeat-containing protein